MSEATEETLTNAEITYIIDILLGPPEDWDEADSEFAMKLYGVPPPTDEDEIKLLEGIIGKFEKENEPVPPVYRKMLAGRKKKALTSQTKDGSQ